MTMKLDFSTTSPKRLVSEALKLIDVPESVRLQDLTLDEPKIEVDIEMMKRVVINLVKNAIDTMPSGGSLTIKSKGTGKGVELRFIDKGEGIREENLDRIWKPLFTTKAMGMGLGLPYARGSSSITADRSL